MPREKVTVRTKTARAAKRATPARTLARDRPGERPTPSRQPARARTTRDPERTSAAILAAATSEFSEKGYGGARIDAIADRASVNKRMLYHYFGDKDALYERVLQEIYRGIRSAEQKLELGDRDPVDGMRDLAHFTWRYFLDHPEFLSLLATENMNKARVLKQASWAPRVNSPLVGVLDDLLSRGAMSGVFRSGLDPVDVYVTMTGIGWFALCNRYTLSVSFDRDLLDPRHLARWGDHMADVVLAWLKKP